MFRRSRVACVALVTGLVAALTFGATATAADPASTAAADAAVGWLLDQQQPDGGFDVAQFQGFETPDAVLAIAEAAQGTGSWSTSAANAAVTALQYGGNGGPTPIDALDDWVTAGVNAGEASKLLLLVVAPLGLNPYDFGPSHHNLAAIVYPGGCGAPPDTAGLFFLETAFVAFGGYLLCGAPDPGVIAAVRAAQRADGGWNFLGDPDDDPEPTDSDVDTTALAMQALVVSGAAWSDPAITEALGFLATQQAPDGAFVAFGSDDPNATSVAVLAITAAGFEAGTSCWRDTVSPEKKGTPYSDPRAWLRSQQEPDGRIASPNDAFGVNTFPTSQSVQALLTSWLPIARASGAPDCAPPPPPPSNGGQGVDPVQLVPRFTG